MTRPILFVLVIAAAALGVGTGPMASREARGGPYLGQAPPGPAPVLFAPGIVSTGMYERDLAMTPDGREIYWTVATPSNGYVTIVVSRLVGGRWTPPAVVRGMDDPAVLFIEPAISVDGSRLFFTRAEPGAGGRIRRAEIWESARAGDGWAAPRRLDETINDGSRVFFASPTRSGTLYFTRERDDESDGIYRARLVDGRYAKPERLPAQVNSGRARFNAFVDREERYVIVPVQGREDGIGAIDYYVVFRRADDTWSEPVNMGRLVNTPDSRGYSPYVSPDGQYFFFMSARGPEKGEVPARLSYAFFQDAMLRPRNGNADIYWMDASFIDALRTPVGMVKRR